MAQEHLDRLSAVDAAFLHQEGSATHMHIGGLALFAGEAPTHGELLEHIRGRLHLVPRYRQRIAPAPLKLGRQRWIDDPRFNLEYHVRHSALPAPGNQEQLHRLAARIFSQRLDRTKPLWELWMVEGLASDGFALISKTHHSLVDGVSGVDLMTTLFDLDPRGTDLGPPPPWVPSPSPSEAQLAATALQDTVGRAATLPLRAAASLVRPARALQEAREAGSALGEVLARGMSAAPDTPLNVRIGPHRRIATVEARLDDLKAIKSALGGTVNDVVLAVSAGAVRRWLHERGLRTEGMDMRVCVPMSTRSKDDAGALGNQITQVVVPFPVYLGDPLERLRVVSEAMRDVKESNLAAGAEMIAGMQDFAPPTLLAQASRMNFSARFFNLLVTNVPGPQVPLYVLGKRLRAVFPLAFLAGERALAIAVMSYDGGVNFGLIADLDSMPDLDTVSDGIERSIAEYLELSERRGATRVAGNPRRER
ncbi:MAG: wax ester/triacylglycerol synthase family O-acyltransferase [Solirubrobacterales bacterium]|nr:wax ester/triacylglycerol synthase family O-acyltransferase [Solirubrobacterales bacterium]